MALKSAASKLAALPGRVVAAFVPPKLRSNHLRALPPNERKRLEMEESARYLKEFDRVNRNFGVASVVLGTGSLFLGHVMIRVLTADVKFAREEDVDME